jgi:membrane fusion protein (multidrug efflux system)
MNDSQIARSPSTIGAAVLLVALVGSGGALAAWKGDSLKDSANASANQPEPIEVVTSAVATSREHRPTATAIGTVLALQSVTLQNELAGTVRQVSLTPGRIVERGTVLVALDVSVERADLQAQEARLALAETSLNRVSHLLEQRAAAVEEVDRARAERDVAQADIARTKAIIERKTVRAPFRARVGLADIHTGQYLPEGTVLTTLQGVSDAAHVDFTVAQDVAARLRVGDSVLVAPTHDAEPVRARIVAIDSRVNPTTRNALVRARLNGDVPVAAPGASVRVQIPLGASTEAVVVPVSALRKGPAGDHVFVITPDDEGKPRAFPRPVKAGEVLGDEVVILDGIKPGERVAASGAFKLREGVLVNLADQSATPGNGSE